jgi:hypothetical protein
MILLVLLGLLLPAPNGYARKEWRHWTAVAGCIDTREQVLIDESRRPVLMTANGCAIRSGEWFDRYTGEVITTPGALDVDHLVSLGAASRAGGWRWSPDRKRAYANDRTFPDHLVAVGASINRSKSDKGPARWLPPRKASRCWYVETYATIAERWQMELPQADRAALAAMRAGCAAARSSGSDPR